MKLSFGRRRNRVRTPHMITLLCLCCFVSIGATYQPILPAIPGKDQARVADDDKKSIVKVNGQDIYLWELRLAHQQRIQDLESQGRRLSVDEMGMLQDQILVDMVNDELLYQEAVRQKLAPSEQEFKTVWDEFKSNFDSKNLSEADIYTILERLNIDVDRVRLQLKKFAAIQNLKRKLYEKVQVPPENLERFYSEKIKEQPDDFAIPESVAARHILIKIEPPKPIEGQLPDRSKSLQPGEIAPLNEKEIAATELAVKENLRVRTEEERAKKKLLEIKDKIKAGASFEDLARVESQDAQSAVKGGDLGYFAQGKFPEAFEDAAFALKVGEVSEPVRTEYGYHLITVYDHKPTRTLAFGEVKEKIENYLKTVGAERDLRKLVSDLRNQAKIERQVELIKVK